MITLFDTVSLLAHNFTQVLMNSLWPGLLLTGLVALLLRWGKSINAATRFSIWWTTLGLVMLAPVIYLGLALAPVAARSGNGAGVVVAENMSPAAEVRITEPLPITVAEPAGITEPSRSVVAGPARSTFLASPLVRSLPLLVGVICSGSILFMILRILVGTYRVGRLLASGRTAPPALGETTRRLARELDLETSVRLLLSPAVLFPMAAWRDGPVVVLPESLPSQLAPRELEAVLLHELAHLQRRDHWTKPLQKLVEALFVFHPAVYWIGRQLDLECEVACDDRVIARLGNPRQYARCLAHLAELTAAPRRSLVPCMALRDKQIFRRFRRILGPREQRSVTTSRREATGTVVAAAAILVPTLIVLPAVDLPFAAMTFQELEQRRPLVEAPCVLLPNPETGTRLVDWSQDYHTAGIAMHMLTEDAENRLYSIWSSDLDDVHLVTRGTVEFTLDGHSLRHLDADGYLALLDRRGRQAREIDLVFGDNGQFLYRYFHAGESRPLTDDDWLADVLYIATGSVRESAPARAREWLARYGIESLTDELTRLSSGSVKKIYFQEAFAQFTRKGTLDRRDFRFCLDLLQREFAAGGCRTDLLTDMLPFVHRDLRLLDDYLPAETSLDDEYEQWYLLEQIVAGDDT